MGLGDFDIVIIFEGPGHLRDNFEEHIDADTHVRRKDARNAPGDGDQFGKLRRGEAGGADDHCLAMQGHGVQVRQHRLRSGEIYEHIGRTRDGGHIIAQRDSEPRAACQFSDVLPDSVMPLPLDGACQLKRFRFIDEADQTRAHAAGSSGHNDLDRFRLFILMPCHQRHPPLRINTNALHNSPALSLLQIEVRGEVA